MPQTTYPSHLEDSLLSILFQESFKVHWRFVIFTAFTSGPIKEIFLIAFLCLMEVGFGVAVKKSFLYSVYIVSFQCSLILLPVSKRLSIS